MKSLTNWNIGIVALLVTAAVSGAAFYVNANTPKFEVGDCIRARSFNTVYVVTKRTSLVYSFRNVKDAVIKFEYSIQETEHTFEKTACY
jgi:hypothetical protein